MANGDGISAFAGYMLGKMAAESEDLTERTARMVRRRLSGEVELDVTTLANENNHLRQLLANRDDYIRRLQEYASALEGDRRRLREWANGAESRIAKQNQDLKAASERDRALVNDFNTAVDELNGFDRKTAILNGQLREARKQMAGAEEAAALAWEIVERLQAQIAALKANAPQADSTHSPAASPPT